MQKVICTLRREKGNPALATTSVGKKSYLVIVGYYHTACFIANVAPRRKLEITVGGIRTLAKAKNEPRREIRTLFQNKLSKTPTLQTSADRTHIY